MQRFTIHQIWKKYRQWQRVRSALCKTVSLALKIEKNIHENAINVFIVKDLAYIILR